MSLILEALRRSEAERQRGKAPGLFVEQAPPVRPPTRRWPAWVWLPSALVLLLAAGWGWREWSRSGDRGATAATTGTAPATAAASEAATVGPAAMPTTAPVPAASAIPGPPAAAPAPLPAPVPAPPAPTPALPRTDPVPASPPAAPPPAPVADPAPAAAVAPVDTDAGLLRLAELAPGARAALPPLQLTMHVYSEDPARRFVIVDGRRLGEGGIAGDGLVVEAIRRDGIVLVHDGRRLLLPRP
ncbi:general secretion pathway protein GspB [Arenimonas composti]|uniref:Type II secretion system protein GspB C-terminal domain-containing protein n=1 Tax=Arenimonas composti TR7-09 = DSM 18010 TaxID=1121013 RepID=A0A091BZR7_9GAMM|nr:general secretion pathway protein GspB [Arenimonas composti]KFN49850.1 hypothetical protein P873_09000 [Arenimonas composti TR7-09 = DSM 18010]